MEFQGLETEIKGNSIQATKTPKKNNRSFQFFFCQIRKAKFLQNILQLGKWIYVEWSLLTVAVNPAKYFQKGPK